MKREEQFPGAIWWSRGIFGIRQIMLDDPRSFSAEILLENIMKSRVRPGPPLFRVIFLSRREELAQGIRVLSRQRLLIAALKLGECHSETSWVLIMPLPLRRKVTTYLYNDGSICDLFVAISCGALAGSDHTLRSLNHARIMIARFLCCPDSLVEMMDSKFNDWAHFSRQEPRFRPVTFTQPATCWVFANILTTFESDDRSQSSSEFGVLTFTGLAVRYPTSNPVTSLSSFRFVVVWFFKNYLINSCPYGRFFPFPL
jgi:hypothetical protein